VDGVSLETLPRSTGEGRLTNRTVGVHYDARRNRCAGKRVVAEERSHRPITGDVGEQFHHSESNRRRVERHQRRLDCAISRVSAPDADLTKVLGFEILGGLVEVEFVGATDAAAARYVKRDATADRS
jgi:hypothetical protein